MSPEDKVKQELEDKFDFLKNAVVVKRERRIFVDCPVEKFDKVFDYAVKKMNFALLSAVTGLDEGDHFGVIYHLAQEGRILLNLRIHVARTNPVIKTITAYFPCADIYERELVDLFGIQVQGLAPGHGYPLPDGWPKDEHPLRKDWKQKSEEKKEGVDHA